MIIVIITGFQCTKRPRNWGNNNIEGKINDYRLFNEEDIFFLILLVKKTKLAAHDRSSGYLAIAYADENLFFCNNGVSFRDN